MESMAEGMIKDLVASGHALADDMTGAPSVLVRCLAAQLEVQLVRANALAAENVVMKELIEQHANSVAVCPNCSHEEPSETDDIVALYRSMKTTATDAFLAEIRAEARNEGINYTASRLAAAFNHGFINKSLREVFDVTRMILSAKEELANELHPIDGLSGEYAEKSLEEWAEQIRKGVQS
ncbi:hypothetical protein UM38_00570 [Salmonella enterica subsp. enterica serovar Muenchen]|nr:hypothetical protein [Salmonella enterica subsp. enterica serovar Muenchen]EEN8273294.1 hypothetical protein [Salmonella enterica subsp. enterica serovar Muenchen]EJJ8734903.1 hypothetical protein [Salmonella enterica]ELE3231415.1 hypothetical protein [Salmonella enterica subsp. enterica serovar Muenchen]